MTEAVAKKEQFQPRGNYRHGGRHTKLYIVWRNMLRRCYKAHDKDYKNYGARGITVAAEWKDFAAFRSYVEAVIGPLTAGRTLDRLNVDGNYEPGNIRWASRREQAENRRRSQWIEFGGCRATVKEWAEVLGLSHGNLARFLDKTEFSEVFHYYSGRYFMGVTR